MKIRIAMIAAILTLASVSLPLAVGQQSTYEKALVLEETQLKLKDAIALYQKVVDGSKDKALAAQAQLHIGLCYEKLGAAEAEKAFRKVIEKYPEQSAAVQSAKDRLSALAGSASSASVKPGDLVLRQVPVPEGGQPSPDGKFIAYVDWDTKRYSAGDLALYEIATGNKKPLTDLSLGRPKDSYPFVDGPVAWAADSSKIAFKIFSSKLCIIDLDGSNMKAIPISKDLTVEMIAGWSVDGKSLIALVRNNKDKLKSIQRILLPNGESSIIKEFGAIVSANNTILSPDGKYLAYNLNAIGAPSNREIRLLTSDGSEDLPIIEHPADDLLMGWTANSRHIIFCSRRNGDPAIWGQAIKDGKKDGEPTHIKSVADSVQGLGVTRNGSFYFLETKLGGNDVYIAQLDLATGKTLKMPENIEPRSERHSSTPFWSPNGDHLGYLVGISNESYTSFTANAMRIYSLREKTKREIPLNFSAYAFGIPRWSEDGKYVYLKARVAPPLQSSVYQVEVSTGQSKVIYQNEGDEIATYSSDGTFIYLLKARDRSVPLSQRIESIVRKEIRTGAETVILQGPAGQRFGGISLSPDGKRLGGSTSGTIGDSFVTNNWVMPADGGTPQPILFSSPLFLFWDPVGQGFLYERKGKGEGLSGLSYQASLQSKKLIDLELEMPRFNNLSFHPDGKTVAFNTVTRSESKVWVMENYLPAKK